MFESSAGMPSKFAIGATRNVLGFFYNQLAIPSAPWGQPAILGAPPCRKTSAWEFMIACWRTALAILILMHAQPRAALAHDFTAGEIAIAHPWARPTPPAAKVGGAYLVLQNKGKTADKLLRATSPVAGVVELHTMRMEGDVMRMRAVPGIDLPPGQTVTLAPGGLHVMLQDLKQPLKLGDRLPLTLVFQRAGQVKVELAVEEAPAPAAAAKPPAAHTGHAAEHAKH